MINYQKSVFDRLFSEESVELSKVDVELSSVKDLNDYISMLKSNISDSEKIGTKYSEAESNLIREWQKLNEHRNVIYRNAMSDSKAVLSDFEKKAKELGVSVESVKEVKELNDLIKKIGEYVKLFDSVKKPNQQI